MVVEEMVALILGFSFCLAAVAVVMLALLVRDYIRSMQNENRDVKYENQLLIDENSKQIKLNAELEYQVEYERSLNKTYLDLFCEDIKKNAALSAGTEKTA